MRASRLSILYMKHSCSDAEADPAGRFREGRCGALPRQADVARGCLSGPDDFLCSSWKSPSIDYWFRPNLNLPLTWTTVVPGLPSHASVPIFLSPCGSTRTAQLFLSSINFFSLRNLEFAQLDTLIQPIGIPDVSSSVELVTYADHSPYVCAS